MAGHIAREIRQKRPFSSAAEELYLNLRRTADALATEVAALLKPTGISPTQYNVLRILRGAGREGLACRKIGDRMVTHDPDITRLLDRLEKRGLIRRERNHRDRRVIVTRITPRGAELITPLDGPLAELHRRQLQHMSGREQRAAIRLLEKARQAP